MYSLLWLPPQDITSLSARALPCAPIGRGGTPRKSRKAGGNRAPPEAEVRSTDKQKAEESLARAADQLNQRIWGLAPFRRIKNNAAPGNPEGATALAFPFGRAP